MSLIESRSAIEEATRNQRAAADPDVSAWVAASAGSGKTKVLTDRLLNLLLAGTRPQRLLCLTFTKAASAEMANRLSRTLAHWTVLDETGLIQALEALDGRLPSRERIAKARRLFAEVLDAPGGLKIQTIHAFAQSLLGRFPLEAGVPPNFRLADDRMAATLLDEAERSVLESARAGRNPALGEALAVVTERAAEQTVRDLLKAMLVRRTRFIRAVAAVGGIDGMADALHGVLGCDPTHTDAGLRLAASDETAFDRQALHDAASALAAGSKTDIARADILFAWLAQSDPEGRAQGWDDYKRALLTRDGGIQVRLATNDVQKRAPALLDDLTAEANRILAVEERRKALDTALRSASLIRLSDAIIDAYQAAKRRRALLDFEDLVEGARRLLTTPGIAAWVLFKLDEGLEHILIDEAQDTSPAQWEIVRTLAEEFFAGLGAREERTRTVFAVGDVKQSIYSFQGADPAGFTAARQHFAERVVAARQTFRELEMQVSFRSTAAVLRAVDAVFARSETRDGVAETVRGVVREISHRASREGQAGRVELWPVLESEEEEGAAFWDVPMTRTGVDDPRGRLARLIAERIQGWLASGDMLDARGRSVRPGDIMVLVRRRGPFVVELVRALKAAGVPVAGVDRMVLTEQMAVRDLIALGQAMLLPEDDLILATVLKSPLIGLDEDALRELCHDRQNKRVWAELQRRSSEGGALERAFRRLLRWRDMALRLAPHDFYQQILAADRGRARLIARLGSECEDAIDEFLAQALAQESEEPPSLQSFLHAVGSADLEVKRELEGGDLNQVRVMTVHGAKGLQAPIVILPDTVRPPQLRDPVVWHADGVEIPLWAPSSAAADAVSAEARAEARRKMEEEYRRLLYVAMTRAEDRLIVCGWKGKRDPIGKGWFGHARAGLPEVADSAEFPGVGPEGPEGAEGAKGFVLTSPQVAPAPAPASVQAVDAPPPLPLWATRDAPLEPTPPRPLSPSRPAGEEPPVRSPLQRDGTDPFKRGTLLHRLLQLLPDVAPDSRRAAGRALLSRPVHAVDPASVEPWLDEVMAVLNDPEFAPVFAPGSRAEVSIVGQVGVGQADAGQVEAGEGPQIVSGRIDRLAVGPETVLIVDYKTNRPPPSSIDAVSSMYLRQMATYRALVASLYPTRRVRCALLWTDGPSLMAIPDALLQGFGGVP